MVEKWQLTLKSSLLLVSTKTNQHQLQEILAKNDCVCNQSTIIEFTIWRLPDDKFTTARCPRTSWI